jgi:ferredoxin
MAAAAIAGAGGNAMVKVRIDANLCQGHGRCYDLAAEVFTDDDEGYGHVIGDGVVPQAREAYALRAALNCPERAIALTDGT